MNLEPEWDQSVVGHLITQPGPIAKEIKQELLDSAAQTIASKHTSSCQLSQFVQEKGLPGIRIEDVWSLLDANEQSKLIPPDNPQREPTDDKAAAKPESEKTPKLIA